MEIAADKLLNLPMQQPRKIKQVMVGLWAGKPERQAGTFLEAWEALEDHVRGESNNQDNSWHLSSTCNSLLQAHRCSQFGLFEVCRKGE